VLKIIERASLIPRADADQAGGNRTPSARGLPQQPVVKPSMATFGLVLLVFIVADACKELERQLRDSTLHEIYPADPQSGGGGDHSYGQFRSGDMPCSYSDIRAKGDTRVHDQGYGFSTALDECLIAPPRRIIEAYYLVSKRGAVDSYTHRPVLTEIFVARKRISDRTARTTRQGRYRTRVNNACEALHCVRSFLFFWARVVAWGY